PAVVPAWRALGEVLPPAVAAGAHAQGLQLLLTLPVEQEPPALLHLLASPPPLLPPDALAALRLLLNQVSVALRNARLYLQATAWAQRLTALQTAGAAIGATLHLASVLATAVQQAVELVGATAGVVALWHPQGRVLTAQAATHGTGLLDTGRSTAQAGEGLAGAVVRDRRLLLRPAAAALPALVAVPLLWQGDLLGVLEVEDAQPARLFSAEDQSLLMLLGQHTAGAIANARLYERAQGRLHQLTVLQDTSRAIISQLDYDTILQTVLRNVSSLLGTQRGAVYMPDERGSGATIRTVVGVSEDQALEAALVQNDGPIRRVLDAGKTVAVYDLAVELPGGRHRGAGAFCSLLAVPLISQGRVLGALCIYAPQPRYWSPVEAELLLVFASQAAHAMQNALLFERLRAEKATLITTITSMSDGLVVTDAAGRIILANPVADGLFAVPFTRSEGESLLTLLARSPHVLDYRGGDPTGDLLGVVLDQGMPYRGEIDVRGPTQRTLEFSFLPVTRSNALITGGLAVFHDITELRRLNDLKSDFLSMVSHELRTPLTSIKGFVKLVLLGDLGPLTTEQQECLEVADREADRLSHLINDLLDISRIEAGTVTFTWETVAPAPLVAEVLTMLQPQAADLHLTLHAQLPPALPAVRGDRQRIIQILTNLVGNAIKFTPPDGQVCVTAAADGADLRVQVTDTGIGIAAPALSRIFDRFYQVDSSHARARGGTGLGLAITRQLVEGHGGTISVASTPSVGTTVEFTLPLAANA
ncbi:MAG: ATP-binding protein, partial [Chloroflexota bacterium]|nr:ATP-binding protein [Chloroflexota bacterium]